ncbi:MAG: histidine--tRNA ligase [Holosporales bacterium]|jgi:histidyl-tRNA synthetase|nr:histidine--tRNA ligase [Holosporales bacterium]
MKFRPVRGMKDLYGFDVKKYDFIIAKAREVGEKYGYEVINTPIVEYTEVFKRSIGDDTDVVSKEMYTFTDKGGESITLRPEGTAGVIRAIVTEAMTQKLPLKLMYYGQMFRYDRPQKGRYRQFHQIGFECVGDKSPYTDAITIAISTEILNAIGIFDFKILLNTLGDEKTRENYTKAIVKYLSRYEDKLSQESKDRLIKNPLRILDSKDKDDIEICSMAPVITDYLSKEAGEYFEKVCQLLDGYHMSYEISNALVRGLDYYSHTTFELKSTGGVYGDALGGGGRYDSLLSIFGGPNVSGVGFAIGVERLLLFLDSDKFSSKNDKVAVIPVSDADNDNAFCLFKELQSYGIATEFIHIGNLGKKMKFADRLKCRLALIIGEDERKNFTVTVKFMSIDNEKLKIKTIDRSKVVDFVKYNK